MKGDKKGSKMGCFLAAFFILTPIVFIVLDVICINEGVYGGPNPALSILFIVVAFILWAVIGIDKNRN